MGRWFEEYKAVMYKSRWLGMAAGLLFVLCVVREIASLFSFLAVGDECVGKTAFRHDLYLQDVAIAVGVIALWRVVILARSKSYPYSLQIVNWWLLALALSIYIWLAAPTPSIPAVCDPDQNAVCFGIYDMRDNTNYIAIGGILFVLLSLLRLLFTATITFVRNRLK